MKSLRLSVYSKIFAMIEGVLMVIAAIGMIYLVIFILQFAISVPVGIISVIRGCLDKTIKKPMRITLYIVYGLLLIALFIVYLMHKYLPSA